MKRSRQERAAARTGRLRLPLLAALAATACCHVAAAESLRCGGHLVRPGDPVSELRGHCGEPDTVEQETRTFADGGTLGGRCFFGVVTAQRWHYGRGRGSLPAVVTLVDDEVEHVGFGTGGYERGWVTPCR